MEDFNYNDFTEGKVVFNRLKHYTSFYSNLNKPPQMLKKLSNHLRSLGKSRALLWRQGNVLILSEKASQHCLRPLFTARETNYNLKETAKYSLWRRANARNVNLETLNCGQFTLSTRLMIPNYPVKLSHRRSVTVSLETCLLHAK